MLSNNNITEIGAKHLQKALDGNISLKELNLAWNKLRCKGAKGNINALCAMLNGHKHEF